jgi:dethiobiotin synthetase
MHRLQVDAVLLVADAGLGTLNSVRLALPAIHPLPTFVFLNRYDPGNELHVLNYRWLRERDALDVAVTLDDVLRDCVQVPELVAS